MTAPFDFAASVRSARKQIAEETQAYQKRMEFWAGYISAIEEVESHWEREGQQT